MKLQKGFTPLEIKPCSSIQGGLRAKTIKARTNNSQKFLTGFTLIEILIIVAIIGLLASIIMVAWAISAQNRAAMAGYKTSMDSVRAAAEMCIISSGSIIPGSSGDSICDFGSFLGNEKYPQLNKKCQGLEFGIGTSSRTGGWLITTDNPCGGCLLDCDIISCQPASGYETKCN